MVNGSGAAVRPDSVGVRFDDERLVANAGLVLVATLSRRLGIERLVDRLVDLGERAGAARPGRKVLSLVHAIAAGADSIDDADVLRAGGTEALLGHRAMAPSTLGTFLRAFTFGHVRQLDRVLAEAIKRAWAAGAGPGVKRLVIDIDSFVGEAAGRLKQGSAYGYTGERGYHPLLATRAGTGEVLHTRLRKGSAGSGRGALRFLQELVARVRGAGAAGEILIRADSAFYSNKAIEFLERAGCRYSIAVTQHKWIAQRIAEIGESAFEPVSDYPETGICELAETTYGDRRLIVRRVHLHAQEEQTELFAYWRHFAFLTNRSEGMHLVDREHRQHAEVELAIRDLKDQALAHFPSGSFAANAAWTVIAALAHNLGRWAGQLGLEDSTWRAARTIRRWLLAIPGRLTRSARRWTLHLPARWPWREAFVEALARIRALPAAA
ncbi:MAG: IS1380 family transposase [Solirubrobacterales bacterium]